MSVARREMLLAAAFALWGLAIAIALAAVWDRPAPPDQLPGYAAANGFDARGPFRFVLGLIVLPIAVPLLLRPVARRLAADETQPWARNATIAVAVVAIWFAVIAREPLWVLVPFGVAFAAFSLVARVPMDFTRHDWILLPTFNTTLIGLIDAIDTLQLHHAVIIATAIVLAVRLAVTRIPSALPPALAFLLAPLGLALQTGFFARDQRYFGWHALLLVVVTPFVMRIVLRDRRRALAILAFAVYPVAVYAYSNATSLLPAEGKPKVYFFEDSHSLPLASDYLRGERPYRDALPAHGLLEDGFFDYLAFRVRGVTLGDTLGARLTVGTLNAVALYALGFAMTGSPEVGLATYFFWQLTTASFTLRVTPALFTLVLIVLAIRKKNPRYLIAAGVGAVVCGVTSLDYAFYTTLALLIAVVRFKPRRIEALKYSAIGIAAGVIPLFIVLAVFGILDDFLRSTFIEIPSLAGVYALSIFEVPPSIARMPVFPEVLSSVFFNDSFPYVVWCGLAIALAVLLTRTRSRIREPFVIVGLWMILTTISYGERHHLYFKFLIAAMIIPAVWFAIRRRLALAPLLVSLLIILSLPTTHLGIVGWVRRLRGPAEPKWTEVRNVPRARGAFFLKNEAATLASAKRYVDLTLASDETFFDFTNRAILFYLLKRDNPVRFVEAAYYETEERQREVIAAIERNPKVRAALIPDPGGVPVDGVGNEVRAPLVWQYLHENFYPDFREGDVVFWRRK